MERGTIIKKEKLEMAILMYCHQHFRQASQTPFGRGAPAEAIGSDGLTELSDKILQGTFFEGTDYDLFPEIRTFISYGAHHAGYYPAERTNLGRNIYHPIHKGNKELAGINLDLTIRTTPRNVQGSVTKYSDYGRYVHNVKRGYEDWSYTTSLV